MLNGLFHFALVLIQVSDFAMSSTYVIVLLNSFGIVKKGLVYLAKMFTDVTLHFKSFNFCVVLSNQSITQLITPLAVAEFVLDLGEY